MTLKDDFQLILEYLDTRLGTQIRMQYVYKVFFSLPTGFTKLTAIETLEKVILQFITNFYQINSLEGGR